MYDMQDPQNWASTKNLLASLQINLLTFVIYLGSAIYSPGELGVEKKFHVSEVVATLGLTLFMVGYGVCPMGFSPLSELPQVGRSPTNVLTIFVFVWFNFGVTYAPNLGCFLVFRLRTGFEGTPALATGAATIGDM